MRSSWVKRVLVGGSGEGIMVVLVFRAVGYDYVLFFLCQVGLISVECSCNGLCIPILLAQDK